MPTQEKKKKKKFLTLIYPHGIFAAGGAFVLTQEKKKNLNTNLGGLLLYCEGEEVTPPPIYN